MNTVLVPTVVDDPMDFTVIATSPKDMEAGQRSFILWAARKIQAIKKDIAEAQEQLSICIEKKWKTDAWRKQVAKAERRAEFYRKIKMALEAGYYIVPPFPVDIFAIRTKRNSPLRYDSGHSDNHDQAAQALTIGDGRYVDPKPRRNSYSDTETQRDGTKKAITYYYAAGFDEVDFPFKLARSEIKEATLKAMSLKLFDRFGILPRVRKPDPIVCGQILVPDRPSPRWRQGDREAITFFVAWWLDTRTL